MVVFRSGVHPKPATRIDVASNVRAAMIALVNARPGRGAAAPAQASAGSSSFNAMARRSAALRSAAAPIATARAPSSAVI